MNKIVCVTLAFLLLLGCLTACADKTSELSLVSPSGTVDTLTEDGQDHLAEAAPELSLVSPSGTIDTLAEDVRDYLEEAAALYDNATQEELETMTSPKTIGQSLYNSQQPVIFQWKCENIPADSKAVIQLSLTEDFKTVVEYPCTELDSSATEQTQSVWNLMTGVTYYWRVSVALADGSVVSSDTMRFSTEPGPRLITVDGVSNFRDMGGWERAYDITLSDGTVYSAGVRIPQGRIYRSGRLEAATEDGMNTMLNQLGLKMEVDLRRPDASDEKERATAVLKYFTSSNSGAKQYVDFIQYPDTAAHYLRAYINANNYPVVLHCRGGADRTGALAFILEALLGMSEADMIKDYEFTKGRLVQGATDGSFRDFPGFLKAFHALDGATPYEKARNFCLQAGLTDAQIDAIIRNILEG